MQFLQFKKNLGAITLKEQRLLFKSKIVACGVGGVGGIFIELIVRAGIGNILVIDFDRFKSTNLNRQIHCTADVLGKPKIDVLKNKLFKINPKLNFFGIKQKLTLKTYSYFRSTIKKFKPNLIVDMFDNASSRVLIYRIAKELNLPYLFAACSKTNGIVSLFLDKDMEELLNLPSKNLTLKKAYTLLNSFPKDLSAWGPTTNLVGTLAANAALNFILKKEGYPKAPNFWSIDGQNKEIVSNLKF